MNRLYYFLYFRSKILISFLSITVLFVTCAKDIEEPDPLYVTDIDGNVYNVIRIGSQLWMKENLKTTHYIDGEEIPNVIDSVEWRELVTPGYCWMNNDDANKTKYGALYNWNAVNTGMLAPLGWHIPTDQELKTLIDYLDGENTAGCKLKEAGYLNWNHPNLGANNSSNFTALPSGLRFDDGGFSIMGHFFACWTSSSDESAKAWILAMRYDIKKAVLVNFEKEYGFSVRCIKN